MLQDLSAHFFDQAGNASSKAKRNNARPDKCPIGAYLTLSRLAKTCKIHICFKSL